MKPQNFSNIYKYKFYLCCLGCGLKHLGVGKCFINSLLYSSKSVAKIYTQDDPEVNKLVDALPIAEKTAMLQVVKMLVEKYGTEKAPLLHNHYYHWESLKPFVMIAGCKLNFAELKRGQIMELLYLTNQSKQIAELLDSLWRQSQETVQNDHLYDGLCVGMDNCVKITIQDDEVDVEWTGDSSAVYSELFDFEQIDGLPQALRRQLVEIERVSLVMVHVASVLSEEDKVLATLKLWLDLLNNAFENCNNLALVLAINCGAKKRMKRISKTDIIAEINAELESSNIPLKTTFLW